MRHVMIVVLGVILPACGGSGSSGPTGPVIQTTGIPVAFAYIAFTDTLVADGGTPPFTWSTHAGALPAGLSLSAGGVVSGTATAVAGPVPFEVKVTDAQGLFATRSLPVTVALPPPLSISSAALPTIVKDEAYAETLAATGGVPPYSWAVTGGTLPTGLTLDAATGEISGTCAALAAPATVTVTVTDSHPSPATDDQDFELTVLPAGPRFAILPADFDICVVSRDAHGDLLRNRRGLYEDTRGIALHPSQTFVYSMGRGDHLYTYSFDNATGAMELLQTFQFPPELGYLGNGYPLVHPSGQYLFISSDLQNVVRVFNIDPSTGFLSFNEAEHLAPIPGTLALHPNGEVLYCAVTDGNAVGAFDVDVSTGDLTLIGTYPTGTGPHSVRVHPSGAFAYVSCTSANTVEIHAIHPTTGALTPLGLVTTPTAPRGLAVHPTGRQLYVTTGIGEVAAYAVNPGTGALSFINSTTGRGEEWIEAGADGRFVYALGGGFSAYKVNPATGGLSRHGPPVVNHGTDVFALSTGHPVRETPRHAYVSRTGSDEAAVYAIDAGTGLLTLSSTVPTGAGPRQGAVSIDGRFLFIPNSGANSVGAYSIHPGTGALTLIGSAATGANPTSVLVEPLNRFCYVINASGNSISMFGIDPLTGALTSNGSVATASGPGAAMVEPNGYRLFVLHEATDQIAYYLINNFTGALSLSSLQTLGDGPAGLAMSLGGGVLYVNFRNEAVTRYYDLALTNPDYFFLGSSPAGAGPGRLAFDSLNRFLFQVNDAPTSLVARGLGAFPAPDSGLSQLLTAVPAALATESSGRFLYVAGGGGNDVRVFSIDGASGQLQSIQQAASGVNPTGIVIRSTLD